MSEGSTFSSPETVSEKRMTVPAAAAAGPPLTILPALSLK